LMGIDSLVPRNRRSQRANRYPTFQNHTKKRIIIIIIRVYLHDKH
jgi:hypothetical protein